LVLKITPEMGILKQQSGTNFSVNLKWRKNEIDD
jgi:hypothetical protein